MTEAQLEKQGFKLKKQYPHDRFYTRVLHKGCLEVDFTYVKKNKEIATIDVTIDEVNMMPVSLEEVCQLDKILNKQ